MQEKYAMVIEFNDLQKEVREWIGHRLAPDEQIHLCLQGAYINHDGKGIDRYTTYVVTSVKFIAVRTDCNPQNGIHYYANHQSILLRAILGIQDEPMPSYMKGPVKYHRIYLSVQGSEGEDINPLYLSPAAAVKFDAVLYSLLK